MRRIPTVVSLDATPLQYDELGEHYAHEPGNARVEQLKYRANRRCFERAAHVVAWSEWAKQGSSTATASPADKVTVIPPGVDSVALVPATAAPRRRAGRCASSSSAAT